MGWFKEVKKKEPETKNKESVNGKDKLPVKSEAPSKTIEQAKTEFVAKHKKKNKK